MSRNTRTLTFDLFAKNKTTKGFKDAGNDAERFANNLKRAGAFAAAGLAVAGAAAAAFGIQSVKAFAEAEEAQNRLSFAFEKFPALADTSIAALQELNSELQRKTRFDDDAIASGQAVLAQFGLTGTQLRRLTPLLLDYAARTGKDLTTAAEDLGKALLGQGRALKEIGVDFSDTGSLVGNFDSLMLSLSDSVGGFAEQDAETAAGKLQMLQNRFGDIQEVIGAALMPSLERLMDWFDGEGMEALEGFGSWLSDEGIPAVEGFVGWLVKYKDILGPAAVALGTLTAAQWVLNAAMAANPVGLVIAGLGAIIALGALIVTNWNTVSKIVFSTTGGLVKGIMQIVLGVATGIQTVINSVLGGLRVLAGPLNSLLGLFGQRGLALPSSVNFVSGLAGFVNSTNQMIDAGTLGGIEYLQGGYQSGASRPGGATPGGFRAMAAGGIVSATPGGVPAVIGEGQHDELVLPLTTRNMRKYGLGEGGDTYNVTIQGFVGTERESAIQAIVRGISDAKKMGSISTRNLGWA